MSTQFTPPGDAHHRHVQSLRVFSMDLTSFDDWSQTFTAEISGTGS